jgi:hypothetical protein
MCVPSMPGGPCRDTSSDTHNCGVCGHDCLGGPCVAGVCRPCVLVVAPNLKNIDIDATHLYYTEPDRGAVSKVPLVGGASTTLVSGIPARYVSVGMTAVYFAHSYSTTFSSVQSVPLDGGTPAVLAQFGGLPVRWAFDGQNVYLALYTGSTDPSGVTIVVPTDGTAQRSLDVGQLISVNAGVIYFSPQRGVLQARSITGGPVTTLISGQEDVRDLAVYGTDVFAITWGAWPPPYGRIVRVPAGGGPVAESAPCLGLPISIAVDHGVVYWGEDFRLRTLAPDCTARTLFEASNQFQDNIRVDANAIYWIDTGGSINGSVKKLAK